MKIIKNDEVDVNSRVDVNLEETSNPDVDQDSTSENPLSLYSSHISPKSPEQGEDLDIRSTPDPDTPPKAKPILTVSDRVNSHSWETVNGDTDGTSHDNDWGGDWWRKQHREGIRGDLDEGIRKVHHVERSIGGTVTRIGKQTINNGATVPNIQIGGGRRGVIRGDMQSIGSGRRMQIFVGRIDRNKIPENEIRFGTLTFGSNTEVLRTYTAKEYKRPLDIFIKQVRYHHQDTFGVWKFEWQDRLVGHFHMILFNSGWLCKEWIRDTWSRIVGKGRGGDPNERVRTQIKTAENHKEMERYLSKEMLKTEIKKSYTPDQYVTGAESYLFKREMPVLGEGESLPPIGKHWGFINKDEAEKHITIASEEVPDKVYNQWNRFYRKYMRSLVKEKAYYGDKKFNTYVDTMTEMLTLFPTKLNEDWVREGIEFLLVVQSNKKKMFSTSLKKPDKHMDYWMGKSNITYGMYLTDSNHNRLMDCFKNNLNGNAGSRSMTGLKAGRIFIYNNEKSEYDVVDRNTGEVVSTVTKQLRLMKKRIKSSDTKQSGFKNWSNKFMDLQSSIAS